MQLLGKTRLWMKWLSCLETDVRTLSLSWSYHPLCSVPYRLIYLWSITLAHSVSCLSSLQLSPVLIMCSYFHLLPDVVIPLYLLSFSICSIHTIIPLSLQCCLIHSCLILSFRCHCNVASYIHFQWFCTVFLHSVDVLACTLTVQVTAYHVPLSSVHSIWAMMIVWR